MTLPLILQIQEAALDGKSSVTDALRKAKIACSKLGLVDFEKWIDLELNGCTNLEELPAYRNLYGIPEGYNPYHGWNPVIFNSSEQKQNWGHAPIGMSIGAIEDSVRNANADGVFGFPYSVELEQELRNSVSHGSQFRIKLDVAQCGNIVHAVRNILLDWTLAMEKQGITGNDLIFSNDDKEKSAAVTAQTINHISINQVGAFVQNANHSVVQGDGSNSTLTLAKDVANLVRQVEQLLPVADLPSAVQVDTGIALDELKQAADAGSPDAGRLRKGLAALKRVLEPAGETLLKFAVDTAVTKLLAGG